MKIDINYFYLNMLMKRNEYMRMKLSDLPEDFIKQYKLAKKNTKDGYVDIKNLLGMYGLPQSGI